MGSGETITKASLTPAFYREAELKEKHKTVSINCFDLTKHGKEMKRFLFQKTLTFSQLLSQVKIQECIALAGSKVLTRLYWYKLEITKHGCGINVLLWLCASQLPDSLTKVLQYADFCLLGTTYI